MIVTDYTLCIEPIKIRESLENITSVMNISAYVLFIVTKHSMTTTYIVLVVNDPGIIKA